MRITRVRFIGRVWKSEFLKDLMSLFENVCKELRINSFLTPNVPITDFDLFADIDIEDLKSKIVKLLEKHNYPSKRLLSIKHIESVEIVEERYERTLEDFVL
jgi:effector-binding domain-containing protein